MTTTPYDPAANPAADPAADPAGAAEAADATEAPDAPAPLVLGPEVFDDPHRLSRALREEAPVRRVITPRGVSGWLVTRYDDCRAALNDPRLLKDAAATTRALGRQFGVDSPYVHTTVRALDSHMLNTDPPDHTRLRRLVAKAFTAGRVAALRPRIQEITDGLLDEVAARGGDEPFDLIQALAQPLPVVVISELLGIDAPQERANLLRWSQTLVTSAPGPGIAQAADEAVAFLDALVERKRAEPGDDLLSDLVRVSEDGDRLSRDELIAMAMLLMIAGHDTTVNLIGNGTLALLRDPVQLAALRSDSGLVPGAVEEFLRYDGSVHVATYRFAAEPFELAGTAIGRDDLVMVSLLSANRDGERWPEPDRMDIRRKTNGHLAFGHGIHYCLGAPLARLEATVAIGTLVDRFPELSLAVAPDGLRYRQSTLIRGLEELPLRVG